ncbi:MAG: hypothetical protein GY778_30320 [bacterium]|nr:hypothetical protein [bacterium]
MADSELQDRTCRCCDRSYQYPVPRSHATRFYCERCAALSADVRTLLEMLNKRIRRLSREVESLKRAGGSSTGEN